MILQCPKCGHNFGPPEKNKNRRICYLCKRPIVKYEKYMFIKSRVKHRNCDNPTIYILEDGTPVEGIR